MPDNHAGIIITENLTRRFGPVNAVDGLTLAISRGEIFGLVGPDGAGKTTTIRMLAAIMQPSAGRATVAGFDTVKQAEAIKQRIGYMAQQFNLYSDLTVLENLDFYADVFGVRGQARQERTERLLRFAQLTEFTGRRAGNLSGGMKKKLALACALIHQPDILYLDEPTTGVDPVSRREFWDILAELHAAGVTILVSTPYMDEAERCSRVGLMYQGRLVMLDTPEQIKLQVTGELVELRPLPASPGAATGIGLMRRAEAVAAGMPGVTEVQTYGDLLHVFVDDAATRMPELAATLAAAGITAGDMRRTRARMEQAFTSLIRQQESTMARNPSAPSRPAAAARATGGDRP
jgi:ABC-2 type transport system ATP-binding protein